MSLIIETDLKEILNRLDQRIDRIDQKLEGIQKDVTDIKLNVVKIDGEIRAMETRSSIIQPIIFENFKNYIFYASFFCTHLIC